MSINWLCTGRDEQVYGYKVPGGVESSTLNCVNFKAVLNNLDLNSGENNELYNAKPKLTANGVEGLIGLVPYAQGFTVLYDRRLSDGVTGAVITYNDNGGETSITFNSIKTVKVGQIVGGSL